MDNVSLLLALKEGNEVVINNLRLKVTKVEPESKQVDGVFVTAGHHVFLQDTRNKYHVFASKDKPLVLETIRTPAPTAWNYDVLKSERIREVLSKSD